MSFASPQTKNTPKHDGEFQQKADCYCHCCNRPTPGEKGNFTQQKAESPASSLRCTLAGCVVGGRGLSCWKQSVCQCHDAPAMPGCPRREPLTRCTPPCEERRGGEQLPQRSADTSHSSRPATPSTPDPPVTQTGRTKIKGYNEAPARRAIISGVSLSELAHRRRIKV